jgi:hypothetical protein
MVNGANKINHQARLSGQHVFAERLTRLAIFLRVIRQQKSAGALDSSNIKVKKGPQLSLFAGAWFANLSATAERAAAISYDTSLFLKIG